MNRSPKEKPEILFATIAAGGSHVSSAEAMAQAVETHYPGRYRLELSDLMKDFGFERLDARHKRSWQAALKRPWTITWGQRLIDKAPGVTVAAQRLLLRTFARRAAALLAERRPKLVVANHGWLTTALTLSQRRFGLRVPVLTFQTSTLDATALWAEPAAERFILGSPVAKEVLVRLGVNRDKIDVVGYPVRQAFLRVPGKTQARAKLGLKEHFTCLVSLGGEGVGGKPLEHLKTLRQLDFPVQVVVIAGRNAELGRQLDLLTRQDPLLRAEGFIENMADFVAASDLVIGKTGPAAVFESLAVGRPVLAPHRSGGIENRLIDFLETHDLGGYVPTPERLKRAVCTYHADPERLRSVEQRTRQFDFPGMTERVGRYIAHYAETRLPDLSLVGRGIG